MKTRHREHSAAALASLQICGQGLLGVAYRDQEVLVRALNDGIDAAAPPCLGDGAADHCTLPHKLLDGDWRT